jgi:O-antigen ligase
LNPALITLLALAFVLIQALIGGTRLVFSLPSYGILALAALLCAFRSGKTTPAPNRFCLGVSALFFLYVLVRAAFSPVPYLWWTDFLMVLGCLVVYLLAAVHLTTARDRTVVLIVLLLIALAELLIGLRQFSQGDNWMPFGFLRADSGKRASGMFISSIHLAGYLEAVGVMALSCACWSAWKMWARALAGYMALLCYLGVAITGSRGGYLSSAFSLLAFAALSLWMRRKAYPGRFTGFAILTAIVFGGVATATIMLMNQSDLIRHRLEMIGPQFSGKQLDIRIYNWHAALDQFRVSPVVGTGAGTHLYYGRLFRRPQIQADPEHAHSDYLELLAEYGLIGAVGMAAFLFVHLRSCLTGASALAQRDFADPFAPRKSNVLALQLGVLSAIAAYLAHSAVDFNLHIPGNALLFAFIFGIAANPDQAAISNTGSTVNLPRWSMAVLGIAICAWGLPKLPGEYWCEQARIALRNGRYDEAIRLGERALQHERRNPFLYMHIGEAHRASGAVMPIRSLAQRHYEDAVENYKKGLELFPQDESLWVRLGQALDGLRDFSGAEAAYLTAIRLDPNLGVLHAYYAAHLNARGREAEAEVELAKGQRLTAENLSLIGHSTLPKPEPGAPNQ